MLSPCKSSVHSNKEFTRATKNTPSEYYPLIDEWINKLWYMLTMNYMEAIYHIQPLKKKKRHFYTAMKWMNLENTQTGELPVFETL